MNTHPYRRPPRDTVDAVAAVLTICLLPLVPVHAAHKGWWNGEINLGEGQGKGRLVRMSVPSVVHTDVDEKVIDLPITVTYEVTEAGRGHITPHRNWWIQGESDGSQCESTKKLWFTQAGTFTETVRIDQLKYIKPGLVNKGTNWVMTWQKRGNLSSALRLPTIFTACNLKGDYRFEVTGFESSWQPGAEFLFRLDIIDADGERHQIRKAYLMALIKTAKDEERVKVEPFLDGYGFPVALSGWIPVGAIPKAITITGEVEVYTADGRTQKAALTPQTFPAEAKPPKSAFPIREVYLASVNSPKSLDAELDKAKRAGFNVVLMPAFGIGTTTYPSKFFPSKTGEFDALKHCVRRAHQLGIRVSAWFSVFYWGIHGNKKTYPPVLEKHPDWLGTGPNSPAGKAQHHLWPCPANPEVQDYMAGAVAEVVETYDVDGVHLDYCRYPGDFYCFCDRCRAAFTGKTGKDLSDLQKDIDARKKASDPKAKAERQSEFAFVDEEFTRLKKVWDDSRFDAITTVVRNIRKRVQAVKPKVWLEASTDGHLFPTPSPQRFQDFRACLEKGYLDYVLTMTYSTFNWPQRWIPFSTINAAKRQASGLGELKDRLIVAPANYGRSQYEHNFGEIAPRTGRELLPEFRGLGGLGLGGVALFSAYYLNEDQIQALANMSYTYRLEVPDALRRAPGKLNVLFDNSHCATGYFDSRCQDLLELFKKSAAVKTSDVFPLVPELLAHTNAVFTFPIKPLSYDEAQAIEAFVKGGGKVIVIGGDYQAAVTQNNFLLKRFGIEFGRDNGGQSTPLLKHTLTEGVDAIATGGPTALLTVADPAKGLFGRDEKVTVAAYEGKGKLLVVSDEALFERLDQLSHRRFLENVLAWLAFRTTE